MDYISKSKFKAKALEIMREVEKAGSPVIITDHGKPSLELRSYSEKEIDPLERLKGSVVADEGTSMMHTDGTVAVTFRF